MKYCIIVKEKGKNGITLIPFDEKQTSEERIKKELIKMGMEFHGVLDTDLSTGQLFEDIKAFADEIKNTRLSVRLAMLAGKLLCLSCITEE